MMHYSLVAKPNTNVKSRLVLLRAKNQSKKIYWCNDFVFNTF